MLFRDTTVTVIAIILKINSDTEKANKSTHKIEATFVMYSVFVIAVE